MKSFIPIRNDSALIGNLLKLPLLVIGHPEFLLISIAIYGRNPYLRIGISAHFLK